MRILLTGAAGFIGSHLAKKLLDEGFQVLGIDKFSEYYSSEYKKCRIKKIGIENRLEIHEIDLINLDKLISVSKKYKPDYIVHLAAQAGVRLPLQKSEIYLNDNVTSFLNVIKTANESNVKGILYASSSSVYSDASELPFQEKTITLNPKSFYGITKLMNEKMAKIFSESTKIQMRGLRFFTVYGPWGRPDMAYFRLAASATSDFTFNLFGDGSIRRDFTYIDNVVDNTFLLLQNLTQQSHGFNDIVNLGGGKPQSMLDLINEIKKYSKNPIKIKSENENILDSRVTMASRDYLESLIGISTFKPIDQGVKELMTWASTEEIRENLVAWISSTL